MLSRQRSRDSSQNGRSTWNQIQNRFLAKPIVDAIARVQSTVPMALLLAATVAEFTGLSIR